MVIDGLDIGKIIGSLIELAEVAAPIVVTLKTYYKLSSESKKHAAKQSILHMIMEDQFNWELFRKFPVNYGNITNEYQIYHDNGGNGEVTKKVEEYKRWYIANENSMIEMKDKNCRPSVQLFCEPANK